MPNEKNLMPIQEVNSNRTREQHSEDSRKGGVASGVSRRRKRSLKEAADLYLSLPVSDRKMWNKICRRGVDPEDIDNQMAMIIGWTMAATAGDARAAKIIVDLLGEDSHSEEASVHPLVSDLVSAVKKRQEDGHGE